MNRWVSEQELYSEIAGYTGDSADAFFTLLNKWQSSLPALRDTYSFNDIINQSKITRSYKRQWLSFAAVGVAAVIVFGILLFNRFAEKPVEKPAICKTVVGSVLVKRGQQDINLVSGMEVLQSDTIVCDEGSMAVIEIGSATVRIEQNSHVTFDTLQKTQVLSLTASMNKGILYATIKKLHKGDSILVKTKTAVAGVRGTTFLVKSDSQSTKLVVFDGKVLLAPRLTDATSDAVQGVPVDAGKSCVIDTHTIGAILRAVEEKKMTLNEAIQQSIPVVTADEKIIKMLDTFIKDVSEHGVIDEDKPLLINDLYPIVSVTPHNNYLVVTTNNGLYYCEDNRIKWMQDYPVLSKPFIWNDLIIFQSKMLHALDMLGNTRWQIEIEGNVIDDGSFPLRDTLVIPTTKGLMYFIKKNGSIVHKVDCNEPIISKPVLFGQMVCVATADGYLYAVDIGLGVKIYRKLIGQVVKNGIFASYPELYVVTPSSIQKIHLLRDEILWKYNDSGIVAAIESPQGIVFATSKGTIGKISNSGVLQWKVSPGRDIHSLLYTSNGIICIAENVFYQFSDTGEVIWSYTLSSRNTEILSLAPKTVYIRLENSLVTLRL